MKKNLFSILGIKTRSSIEFLDITSDIKKFIYEKKVNEGIILVYTPHTTAGITINENADPSVRMDVKEFIKRKIPHEDYFEHAEGNSPSHIMSSLFSASETLIVNDGKLQLGTWQGIFFCEFDGPRHRKIYIKIIEG